MVAFLLGLLKIIGITLLILLILLLIILAIVLFVPIRYQGSGQISEEKKEASAQVTWLLHLIRCRLDYSYPEKPVISVKVLWIDVLKLLEKKSEPRDTSEEQKSEPRDTSEERKSSEPQDNSGGQSPSENQDNIEIQTPSETQEHSETTKTRQSNEAGETLTLKEKIEKIIFKITSLYDKMKNIIYNIKYYINILQEEDTKILLGNAWGAIVKILKSIRPRVFELNAEFGFETPDTTGQVYGVYCMVMPMLGQHVQLVPNFEEQVFDGKLKLKGCITIWVLLINILRVLFDKRLQPLINKFKNGGKQNGGK